MKNCILFVDVETDDMLTCKLLTSLPNVNIVTVICGEGKAEQISAKIDNIKKVVNCPVLSDVPSNYDWYPSSNSNLHDHSETDNKIINLIETEQADTIICIMSHAPLLRITEKKPNIWKKCNYYGYGSFNFRRSKNNAGLLELLKQFKSSDVTESYYAFGPKNSLNISNARPLFEKLASNHKEIYEFSKVWNKMVLDDAYDSCVKMLNKHNIAFNGDLTQYPNAMDKNENDKMYYDRNFKVYQSIKDNIEAQMVFADMLVALAISGDFDKNRCRTKILFDSNGYTTEDESGVDVTLYKNIDFDEAVKWMVNKL